MRVTIRADATRTIGAGHAMRCMALAEELTSRGAEVNWHGRLEVKWVSDLVEANGWTLLAIPENRLAKAGEVNADLVIVDSYASTWEYQEELRRRGTMVVSITDDFHQGFTPANLWVNPGVALGWNQPARGRFLDGPEFVLLRSEVKDLRQMRASGPTSGAMRPRVVAFLGGTDFSGLSDAIPTMAANLVASCDVIAGPSDAAPLSYVRWLPPGPGLMKSAALADLVVSPAGVSSWEMLHIGVPLALVQATRNQRGNYEWMVSNGLTAGLGQLGEALNGLTLADRVREALPDSRDRAIKGQRWVDGFGAIRVVDAIQELF